MHGHVCVMRYWDIQHRPSETVAFPGQALTHSRNVNIRKIRDMSYSDIVFFKLIRVSHERVFRGRVILVVFLLKYISGSETVQNIFRLFLEIQIGIGINTRRQMLI